MNVYEPLSNPLALSIFVLTLAFPILVGIAAMRRTRNESDFFVGGRAMNRFVVALSAVSSGRSSWLVLGVSGMAYTMGVGAVWAIVGYILAELFQFIYIGKKLRQESESYGSITLLDYFETKFNDSRHMLRIAGALIIGLFITAYVAAQFNAGAKALSTALGMSPVLALTIAGLLVLIYMVLGGFIAVAYNDVVRAVIMIVGLVIFPAVGLVKIGGLTVLLDTLKGLNPAWINPWSLGAGVIIGFLGIGLGSPGQPHIVVRYMAIDDAEKLRQSAVIGTVWNVVMGWGAVFIGLLGRALVPNIEHLPNADAEMVYLHLSADFFGPVLYGLLVGGIFAAILSTADSQLLVLASTFVNDLYQKIFRKGSQCNSKSQLRLCRLVVIFSGILALFLAYWAKDLIFWLVLFAWGGLGAAFGSTLIMTLYWKHTSRAGVLAGMITGTLVTVIWKLWFKAATGLYELIPAFGLALAAIVVASRLWPSE